MCLGRNHDRRTIAGGAPCDAFSRPHLRTARHLLDPGPVRGAQHELVGPPVVEVDEAGVSFERLGDLARDET
jgi:hypothetical protein